MGKPVTFRGFAGKLQEAAEYVQRVFDEAIEKRIEELTEEEGGKRRLKTVTVTVDGRDHDVALLQIMSPKRLYPESLKVKFTTTMTLDGDGDAQITGHCGLLKRGVEMDVEMEFRSGDQLEVVELVRERLNKDLAEKLQQQGG